MIEVSGVVKTFDSFKAVDDVSVTIKEGVVFGLVGTNGAGKSTLMRMIAGIYKPERGSILVDDLPVYENPSAKKLIFYISDEQYFLPNSTPIAMGKFYQSIYPEFDWKRFLELLKHFELGENRKIKTFSKGMKKQFSILCGICAKTKYLICDESFDGLDPVMRQAVKSLFAAELGKRDFTPIIASHNLRELEDICDHVGLLHKGGVLLSKDLEDLKYNIHKVQCVFREDKDKEKALEGLEILQLEQRGSLCTVTIRGTYEKITTQIERVNPLFSEVLPLSLEEIFISETEVAGYDIKKIIF